MDSWGGHHQVTTDALLSIFDREVAGTIELTQADRVLYTVCEIRAAVATRNLVRRLGSDNVVDAIRSASEAFVAIGAVQFVRDLNRAEDEVASAPTAARRRQCLAVLEDRLLCTEDPIDVLIARYAWGRRRAGVRGPSRTPFATSKSA
jgi:hypothetical protein